MNDFRYSTKKEISTGSNDQHELKSNGQSRKSIAVKLIFKRKCCLKTSFAILACLLFLIAVALIFNYCNVFLIFVLFGPFEISTLIIIIIISRSKYKINAERSMFRVVRLEFNAIFEFYRKSLPVLIR